MSESKSVSSLIQYLLIEYLPKKNPLQKSFREGFS